MTTWLIVGSALYLLTLYVPAMMLVRGMGVRAYLGHRDHEVITGHRHGRAQRAARNFQENYPVFMGLGVLSLVVADADISLATTGAMLFVAARLAYLVIYIAGVPYLRSAVFALGWVGLLAMGLAII